MVLDPIALLRVMLNVSSEGMEFSTAYRSLPIEHRSQKSIYGGREGPRMISNQYYNYKSRSDPFNDSRLRLIDRE